MKNVLLTSFGLMSAKGKALVRMLMLVVLLSGVFTLLAQSKHRVSGKMYIDSVGFAYISVGDTLNLKKTIKTARHLTVERRGALSFAEDAGWKSGNGSYVNGYVRSHKSDFFVFPVGDTSYRPVAISGAADLAPTDAAHYSSSMTQYPVTALEDSLLAVISEVWIIQGKTPATITLTWTTDISAFAGYLNQVCVAGWDTTENQWVRIESEFDLSSLFGTASDLELSGSVTTTTAFAPDDYAAYTLGKRERPPYEIWNWADLAYINTLIDNQILYDGDGITYATVDKLSDHSLYKVMQNLGIPNLPDSYDNGSAMDAAARTAHPGDAIFGWYGFEGFEGNGDGIDNDAADYELYTHPGDTLHGWHKTEGWVPIGKNGAGEQFSGIFDGQGFAVGGLWIDRNGSDYQGLFGVVQGTATDSARIENLGVNISDKGVVGHWNVGGLVGEASYSTISNCYVTGDVTSPGNAIGGLAGRTNHSKTSNSYATGNVSAGDEWAGGLVGNAFFSVVANCYATGNVEGPYSLGGLAGASYASTITNCYATGALTSAGNEVGGLVGSAYTNAGTTSKITGCFALNPSITGDSDLGRIIGYGDPTTLDELDNNQALACMRVNGKKITETGDDENGLDLDFIDTQDPQTYIDAWGADYSTEWFFDYPTYPGYRIETTTDKETNLPILSIFTTTAFPNALQPPRAEDCSAIELSLTVFLEGPTQAGTGGSDPYMINYIQQPDSFINSVFSISQLPLIDPYGMGATCPDIQDTLGAAGKVVDWILVMILENVNLATPPYSCDTLEMRALLLKPDGSVVDVDGDIPLFTPQNGPVHIVVKHRNHLAVMSQAVANFGTDVMYDFSASGQAYQAHAHDPMISKTGVYCMWAGDVNDDDVIDATDQAQVRTDVKGIPFDRYIDTDINMDGITDNIEAALMEIQCASILYSPMFYFTF